ncbi:MAG: ImmA/IrrE family metallo-endopeptidase [Synergistaceae bacterium]|nr:ImmA/IrrE family metallo-endopeptidase [Synergistaceae bacterium]MBQ7170555.1 ImmA/IrrE family metallo-endopeptidase [Synergistaceae bacterium]
MAGHSNIPELDKLFQEVSSYRSSKNYMELFDFIKRFKKIAPYNAMLIHMQKPGSKYVASVQEWWKEFKRVPKPGARPLIILRTFGPVSFVYELEDTEGKEFPQELQNPFKPKGEISEAEFASFVENLYFDGFRISYENYGTEYAGAVQTVNYREPYTDKNNTRYSFRIPFAITVNSNHDKVTQLATIYHELGHVYCGHLGNQELDYLPKRYGLSHQVKEFEAESVCWLLCEREGIKNPSAEYLSNYVDRNNEIPLISIDTVFKAAAKIERLRNSALKAPRKELREE